MKEIFKKCWDEYIAWLKPQWKKAWELLKEAIITLIQALFTWLYTIIGTVFKGLWDIIIKPIGTYIKDLIINWINRI